MQIDVSSPMLYSNQTAYYRSAEPEHNISKVINGVEVISNIKIDNILKDLPREGTLIKGLRNSYILEVSADYHNKIFDFLADKYGTNLVKGSVGLCAHVSVVRPSIGDPVINDMMELGKTFTFEPLYLGTVVPDHDHQWEKVYIVVIRAKELEDLRTKYNLNSKIKIENKEHEFHITIATKQKI